MLWFVAGITQNKLRHIGEWLLGTELKGKLTTFFPLESNFTLYTVKKAIKIVSDITWNEEENEILHEVSRFPRYSSCYIAESRLPLVKVNTVFYGLKARVNT